MKQKTMIVILAEVMMVVGVFALPNGEIWPDNKPIPVNYDEDKVPPYTLQDPLAFADGQKVESKDDWSKRREEILGIVQREMLGEVPRVSVEFEKVGEEIFSSNIICRTIQMKFQDKASTSRKVDWQIYLPRNASGRLPSLLALNFDDKITASRLYIVPIEDVVSRGFAFITAKYTAIVPDNKEERETLIKWAWALMRGMDMIESQPELDASRVVVTGFSRLGKAALFAGAFDTRFAAVIPVQTGGAGVPLMKREFGENLPKMLKNFPHWFTPRFSFYSGREAEMPFDSHLVLSCIAPRPLLVLGADDPWFDTRGEWLAVQAAAPVWRFLECDTPKFDEFPADDDLSSIGARLGYARHAGKHAITAADWSRILDFSIAATITSSVLAGDAVKYHGIFINDDDWWATRNDPQTEVLRM